MTSLVNKREFLAAGLGLGAARAARSQDKPAVIASKLPASSPAQPIAETVSRKVLGFCHELSD